MPSWAAMVPEVGVSASDSWVDLMLLGRLSLGGSLTERMDLAKGLCLSLELEERSLRSLRLPGRRVRWRG